MPAAAFFKYINNKRFLFGAVIIFIIPFIFFSFWNFPAADDYMIIDQRSQFSFWQLQNDIYHNWTGRYFATFTSSLFSYSGFLYSHYYLHAVLLLLLTIFSWLFCLIQINRHLLNKALSFSSLALLSMLLLILEINIIPEPVTAFYWFSSAVTYQLPLIILISLTGVIINSFFNLHNKIIRFIIASLLIIMLNGCNEIITLFVLINATCLLVYFLFNHKKLPLFISVFFLINTVSACFMLFAPGIASRSSLFAHSSVLSAAGIAFIKFLIFNWYFLKEPLWWFFLFWLIIFLTGNKNNLSRIFKNLSKPSVSNILAFYIGSNLLVYIPVLYVTNGSVPLRAENIICFLNSLLLLFVIAAFIPYKTDIKLTYLSIIYKYRFLILSIVIFSTANMKKITDSLLSGYFYSLVMKERLSLFENAKQLNIHNLTFDEYATAAGKKLKAYPVADRQIIKDIIVKPPPLICFGSDVNDMNYIKELYGIKNLYLQK